MNAESELASFNRIAPDVRLGNNVKIHGFVNLYGCVVGDETTIGTFVEIQSGVEIGRRCKIGSHSFICTGVVVQDECFIGHNVVFINDRRPSATTPCGQLKSTADWKLEETRVERGASIGSGAVILCGITIGARAVIGAGAVVTKNVPPASTVLGVPARIRFCVEPELIGA